MTEGTKKHLMQCVYKLAEHYEIPNAALVSFKKRALLLELLNTKNANAYKVMYNLIESTIKSDRILNDKEKQEKKPEHWAEENLAAQETKIKDAQNLIRFFESEGIDKDGLAFEN